jgi:hypothetical protein
MRFHRNLLVILAVATAASGQAQSAPKHEFGLDFVIGSLKSDGDDSRSLLMTTPFDVRIGFLTQGPLMVETRFGFSYFRAGGGGGSALEFTPGINLMLRLGKGSGLHNQMGPYLTAGGSVDIARVSGGGDSSTETQPGINVGLGTRMAWGSAAFRPELFFAKVFETDETFAANVFGVRLGLSFFH